MDTAFFKNEHVNSQGMYGSEPSTVYLNNTYFRPVRPSYSKY